MHYQTILLVIAASTACIQTAGATQAARFTTGCSAYSNAGDAAIVTLADRKKTLELKRASGESHSLDLPPVNDKEIGCAVFSSTDGRFVAVALNRLHSEADSLHVIVADAATGKWAGEFVVRADETLGKPLTLAGFFESRDLLVVLGKPSPSSKHSFSTVLLDVQGKRTAPAASRTLPDNTSVGNSDYADVKSNRLWFHSDPRFCPLRSVPLVGDGPEGSSVDEDVGQYVCDGSNNLGFAEENELMVTSNKEPRDLVWRVDLNQHTADRIELPATDSSNTAVERCLLSPDGTVFAVVRNLLSNLAFGDAHSGGTEVDLGQTKPLKLIGKVRLKTNADPMSISVDHRNGAITILYFTGDKWNSEQVKGK
jgi:hypothetical protein